MFQLNKLLQIDLLLCPSICLLLAWASTSAEVLAAEPSSLRVKASMIAIPEAASKRLQEILDPAALQILDADGTARLTFWLPRSIAMKATPVQIKNGLTYREIPETTLIGLVQVHDRWIDFRKQEIAEGLYTLRLAIQPELGDHEGTTPHPEFALLVPLAEDPSDELMEVKDLVKKSRGSTTTDHPAVLLLMPAHQAKAMPRLSAADGGIVVLGVQRKVAVGHQEAKLGFGFTVAGSSPSQ